MRNVKALIWDIKTKTKMPIVGKFHQWGQMFEEFEAGPGNMTIAIIELETGEVVMAYPEDVTFITKEVL